MNFNVRSKERTYKANVLNNRINERTGFNKPMPMISPRETKGQPGDQGHQGGQCSRVMTDLKAPNPSQDKL